MKKFVLYTIGFALLAFVPTILFTVLFNSGGGDVAPFILGVLAVGAVLAGAVCLKERLDRMEETLNTVSKTLREVQSRTGDCKGQAGSGGDQTGYRGRETGYVPKSRLSVSHRQKFGHILS